MPILTGADNNSAPTVEQRVRDWLFKQGYPLEFRTAAEFSKAGFQVRQGDYVQDTRSGKLREIDVLANVPKRHPDQPVRVSYVVECKWSREKPWVIFTSSETIEAGVTISQTIASDLGHLLLWAAAGDSRLNTIHTFHTSARIGFGGRQAFSQSADLVFSALQSVVSAAKAKAEAWNKRLKCEQSVTENLLPRVGIILFPLIVIEGRLFEARLHGTDFVLEETKSSRLHWRGSETWEHIATVDVVTFDFLEEFLSRRISEVDTIFDVLQEYFDSLRSCCQKLELGQFEVTPGPRGFFGAPPLLQRLNQAFEERRGVH